MKRKTLLFQGVITCSLLLAAGISRADEGGFAWGRTSDLAGDHAVYHGARGAGLVSFDIIKDPDASIGKAAVMKEGTHNKGFFFLTGYFPTTPGRYKVTFRMKVKGGKADEPVAQVDACNHGWYDHVYSSRAITPSQMESPDKYQDFTLSFLRGELGRAQYRVNWLGRGEAWFDKVSVERIKDLTDEELLSEAVKAKDYQRPSDTGLLWKQKRDGDVDVLYLRDSRFWENWKIEEALKKEGFDLTVNQWTKGWNQPFKDFSYFPQDYQELFEYDLVIMGNGDVQKLTVVGRRILVDYLKEGGVLLYLGGYSSFFHGRIGRSMCRDVLPVITGKWDLVEAEDEKIQATPAGKAWEQWTRKDPRVLWVHSVKTRNGAEVILKVGEIPLLTRWKHGKGTVLAFSGTVLGEKKGRSLSCFWETDEWTRLIADEIRRVARQ